MQQKPNGEEIGASKQQGGKGSGRKWRRRRQGQPLLPEGSEPTFEHGVYPSVFAGGGGSATPPMSHWAERRLESSFEDSSSLPGSRGKADCAAEHRDSASSRGIRQRRWGNGVVPKVVAATGRLTETNTGEAKAIVESKWWRLQRTRKETIKWRKRKREGDEGGQWGECTEDITRKKRKRKSKQRWRKKKNEGDTKGKVKQTQKDIAEGVIRLRAEGATTGKITSYIKKMVRRNKSKRRERQTKSRAMNKLRILKEVSRNELKRQERGNCQKGRGRGEIKGGTWNTRGWGGALRHSDPYMKTQCLLRLVEKRKWKFCLFTDTRFEENGVREYRQGGRKWTVITQGKVAIAIDEEWAKWWRDSGAKVFTTGTPENKDNRVMGIQVNRRGWRRGIFLVAGYAPTSTTEVIIKKEREKYRNDLVGVSRKAEHNSIVIIGGT